MSDKKTLGQVAYEASKGMLGGFVLSWGCIATEERDFFEAAAKAVSEAVRAADRDALSSDTHQPVLLPSS